MDFSEVFRRSGPEPCFSPDGQYVATAIEYRLIIRDTESLNAKQIYGCLDNIDFIEWSPNSAYVLCGLYSRALVQIWSVDNNEWTCKIDEGPAGVSGTRWSPDGGSILVVADMCVRMAVWSLTSRKCIHLSRGPKFPDKGIEFSPNGRHLAVLERCDCKDSVTVYDTATWNEMATWPCATVDAVDLKWSPGGTYLAVQDFSLSYKVCIHAPAGGLVSSYAPPPVSASDASLDPGLLSSASSAASTKALTRVGGLGVRKLAWAVSEDLLAIGGFDQEIRILDNVTWNPLLQGPHVPYVTGPHSLVAYVEREETSGRGRGNGASEGRAGLDDSSSSSISNADVLSSKNGSSTATTANNNNNNNPSNNADGTGKSKYVIASLPLQLTFVKPRMEAANLKIGIEHLAWSGDGRFVASSEASLPHVIWIWDLRRMELCALLQHLTPVQSLAWAPQGCTLIAVCGSARVYLWSPGGASVVHVPLPKFRVFTCEWNATGTSILLGDRDTYCCAYLTS